MAALARWLEHKESFQTNTESSAFLGALYRGFETDFAKVRRLHTWYRDSLLVLHKHPGLAERLDLTAVSAGTVQELSVQRDSLLSAGDVVRESMSRMQSVLKVLPGEVLQTWPQTPAEMVAIAAATATLLEFKAEHFARIARPDVPIHRVCDVMAARIELDSASPSLQRLLGGCAELDGAGGAVFHGLAEGEVSSWGNCIKDIDAIAATGRTLCDLLAAFVVPTATIAAAEALLEAKLSLDSAVRAVAPSTWDLDCDGWESRISAAMAISTCAESVATATNGECHAEYTVDDVFDAVGHLESGRAVLARLRSTSGYQKTFGPALAGEATDIDALAATQLWGERLGRARDVIPSLCGVLCCAEAGTLFAQVHTALTATLASHDKARESLAQLERWGRFDWDAWQQQVRGAGLHDHPTAVHGRIALAASSAEMLRPWAKYHAIRKECIEAKLSPFIDCLESGEVPASLLVTAFEYTFYRTLGTTICSRYPELARFAGAHHDQLRVEYMALDRKIIEGTGREYANRINKARRAPGGNVGVTVGEYTEMALLRHELSKQRRHIPIRQLVRRAGRALQELKPCFMMGPLSVAQYLDPDAVEFDLVVMDEASQLRPEDALGAIARGKQLVVVGDPKQLPPTSFFDRLADDDDDLEPDEAATVVSGMESILAICQQLFHPPRTLRWHYRSQHESLIAFSNHYFYGGSLIVFPAPYERNRQLGVRYRFVRGGVYKDRRNVPEAQRVVDAALEHMRRFPRDSLGIVTLNQTQRELIEELLDRKLRDFEEGRRFLEEHEAAGWPFFVKNLENVQGDERDVIFISTTYGKVPGGDAVRQNFGPISRPDGWRRLNVLFTRARRRLELFTSLHPEDVREDETTPEGTRALRQYLDYAKHGFLGAHSYEERSPDSDFEVAIANLVRGGGYEVRPQLGVAGFFIDLAVRNPDRPGEYIAGIECDGASYHSGASARDRDRIRQEILETLGWRGRIFRIWSTDWFTDPQRTAEKLLTFLAARRVLSAQEESPSYDDTSDDIGDADVGETISPATASVTEEFSPAIDEVPGEDLYVEVGDRVTYTVLDAEGETHSVLLVDTGSNPKLGLVNENTPLGKALIGLCQGEHGDLHVPNQRTREVKVLRIERRRESVN